MIGSICFQPNIWLLSTRRSCLGAARIIAAVKGAADAVLLSIACRDKPASQESHIKTASSSRADKSVALFYSVRNLTLPSGRVREGSWNIDVWLMLFGYLFRLFILRYISRLEIMLGKRSFFKDSCRIACVTMYTTERSEQQPVVQVFMPYSRDSFSSEKISDFGTVALSFVCDKYYSIID